MKVQIKREFTLILLGSLLIGIFYRVGWFFPIRLMIMSTLLINFGLAVCMWYSERINRPMLYQVIVIFYLGITAYCFVSINNAQLMGVRYDGKLVANISVLLLMSVIMVSLVSFRALYKAVKSRIDLWCPPIWPLVIAGIVCYSSNKALDENILKIGVLFGMGGLILATAYKNNRTQNRSVAYEITTKHYLRYLCLFALLAFSITEIIPKADVLPGTVLLKKLTNNWGQSFSGDFQTTSKLSRNPTQSEEIVLQVRSEMPIYLKALSYSTYQDGEWMVYDKQEQAEPILEEVFYSQKKLFDFVLDKMTEEIGTADNKTVFNKYRAALQLKSNETEQRSAFIEEARPFKQYFTCNDLCDIKILDEGKLEYYPSSDCFVSDTKKDDVAYTIEYIDYPLLPQTREAEILKTLTQKEYQRLLDSVFDYDTIKGWTDEIEKLYMANYLYEENNEIYLQLPENMNEALVLLSKKITDKVSGDLPKAQAICDFLSKSGVYTYRLNAPYIDKQRDPIIDFLFYGHEGICQDFASSMTLLCRGIGLPARYVSGYYASERDWDNEETEYIVRAKDAHAFVEVYIAGYGWMTFDPTPVSMHSEELIGGDITQAAANNYLGNNVGDYRMVVIVIGILLCILLWIYPIAWLRNAIFKWYMLKLPPQKSINLLMEQTLRLLADKSIYLEDKETISQLAKRLEDQYMIKITPITKPFENYYYGSKKPLESDMLQAMACYNELKKNKKWKPLFDPNSST